MRNGARSDPDDDSRAVTRAIRVGSDTLPDRRGSNHWGSGRSRHRFCPKEPSSDFPISAGWDEYRSEVTGGSTPDCNNETDMIAHHRGRKPRLESVEPRTLLSTGMGGLPAIEMAPPSGGTAFIHLDGTLRGHYRANSPIPDVGTTDVIRGSGHVSRVHHAFVTGTLHSIGFIAAGQAQGDIFLAGTRGTIALHLVGPLQRGGPQGLPDVFQFSVSGGTGKYKGVVDTGTAVYVGIPSPSASSRPGMQHGHFTLVLTSDATPAPVSPAS